MTKSWLLIIMIIFITVMIWTGFEVYSCFGGLSDKIFGMKVPVCNYNEENTKKLLLTPVTPIHDNFSLYAIEDIEDRESLVIIKDKSELEKL